MISKLVLGMFHIQHCFQNFEFEIKLKMKLNWNFSNNLQNSSKLYVSFHCPGDNIWRQFTWTELNVYSITTFRRSGTIQIGFSART